MKTTATLAAVLLLAACGGNKAEPSEPSTPTSPTTTTSAGANTSGDLSGLRGQALADSIMAQWQRAHPERNWQQEVRHAHPNIPGSADNSSVIGMEKKKTGQDQTYGRYTEQDIATWKRETEKLVLAGARIFHSAKDLGSTVAVSCDMCHPDAANTHPETYPKFQVQMGRVALLRDMINWCLMNPLRAPAMKADDFRMRALEAYITAERKGKALDYGKH